VFGEPETARPCRADVLVLLLAEGSQSASPVQTLANRWCLGLCKLGLGSKPAWVQQRPSEPWGREVKVTAQPHLSSAEKQKEGICKVSAKAVDNCGAPSIDFWL